MKDKIYVSEEHVIVGTGSKLPEASQPPVAMTTYPIVITLDELKQQIDVLVSSGRGVYKLGVGITVNDNNNTIYINGLSTV